MFSCKPFFWENSIGSLGNGKSEDHVAMVTVNGAKFFGTTNGVRIKTWQVKFSSPLEFCMLL